MEKQLPVLIIGAGVSGLALAQGLQKNSIPFRIFEEDQGIAARSQGYRVHVSQDGISALVQLLSINHFKKLQASCGESHAHRRFPENMNAITGDKQESILKQAVTRMSHLTSEVTPWLVDRTVLRAVLLEGIEDDITWSTSFASYREEGSYVVANFTDGSSVDGSVIVGADGSWSRVRRQLCPQFQMLDTEARLLFGKTTIGPELGSGLSERFALLVDPKFKCLYEHMVFDHSMPYSPPDYIYWTLFLRNDSKISSQDLFSLDRTDALDLAQRLTEEWHSSFRPLFKSAKVEQISVIRVVTTSPDISTLPPGRVTLIGDAIHPMAPTAALGATTALRDAGLLVSKLAHDTDLGILQEALDEYQQSMRVYAKDALLKTLIGGRVVFGMREYDQLPVIPSREL